jgi:hypothetical protein
MSGGGSKPGERRGGRKQDTPNDAEQFKIGIKGDHGVSQDDLRNERPKIAIVRSPHPSSLSSVKDTGISKRGISRTPLVGFWVQ